MDDYFAAIAELKESHAVESEQKFRVRVIAKLCKEFEIDRPDDSEAEWYWFQENYPTFPCRMDSRKLRVGLAPMFTAMTRTEVWNTFFDVLAESEKNHLAMFVPVQEISIFAIHNCWHFPAVAGFTRLIRQASSGEKGIIFEPLDSFVSSVKSFGWSP